MLNRMAPTKPRRMRAVVGAAEAQRILNVSSRGTIIRWGREGRITIAHQMPGNNGAFLYDLASVQQLAAQLAQTAS